MFSLIFGPALKFVKWRDNDYVVILLCASCRNICPTIQNRILLLLMLLLLLLLLLPLHYYCCCVTVDCAASDIVAVLPSWSWLQKHRFGLEIFYSCASGRQCTRVYCSRALTSSCWFSFSVLNCLQYSCTASIENLGGPIRRNKVIPVPSTMSRGACMTRRYQIFATEVPWFSMTCHHLDLGIVN